MDPNYFNQANYKNVPAGDVNWAQLAQRWIMTRAPAPDPQPPRAQYPSGLNQYPGQGNSFGPPHPMNASFQQQQVRPRPMRYPPPLAHQQFPPHPNGPPVPLNRQPMAGFFNSPGALNHNNNGNQQQQMWHRHPGPPLEQQNYYAPPAPHADYTQDLENDEEYQAHYDASLEQDEDQLAAEFRDDGAPVGAMSHWFSGMTEAAPSKAPLPSWMVESLWSSMPNMQKMEEFLPNSQQFTPLIDHHMRKKLPAWILEGLEKAEREKQKKAEKEQMKKKYDESESAKQARRAEKRLGKFDSDSEDEEAGKQENLREESPRHSEKRKRSSEQREDEPIFPLRRHSHSSKESRSSKDSKRKKEVKYVMSEQERKEEALLAIRRLMTSVLLEATDGEIQKIAKDALARAKRKEQPKILVKSSALAALSSLGSDDDSESEPEAPKPKKSSHREDKREESSSSSRSKHKKRVR